MPSIEKMFRLEVSPERFVEACDPVEFQELQIEVERRLRRELTQEDIEEFKRNINECKNIEG